jgi:hypothetical protein
MRDGAGEGRVVEGEGWVREVLCRVRGGCGNFFNCAGWEWEDIGLPAQLSSMEDVEM